MNILPTYRAKIDYERKRSNFMESKENTFKWRILAKVEFWLKEF